MAARPALDRARLLGPLHHYLNALFMLIFPGKALGPQVLNILAASLTAIPLYGFTLTVFGSRRGAVFAASIFVFSPIALWTSLQALSEVSYGLFLASALFALSINQDQPRAWRSAAIAGLLMTFAAATRYEAWVLIAAFPWWPCCCMAGASRWCSGPAPCSSHRCG